MFQNSVSPAFRSQEYKFFHSLSVYWTPGWRTILPGTVRTLDNGSWKTNYAPRGDPSYLSLEIPISDRGAQPLSHVCHHSQLPSAAGESKASAATVLTSKQLLIIPVIYQLRKNHLPAVLPSIVLPAASVWKYHNTSDPMARQTQRQLHNLHFINLTSFLLLV